MAIGLCNGAVIQILGDLLREKNPRQRGGGRERKGMIEREREKEEYEEMGGIENVTIFIFSSLLSPLSPSLISSLLPFSLSSLSPLLISPTVILDKANGVMVSGLGYASPTDPLSPLYCVTSAGCFAFTPSDKDREREKMVVVTQQKVWVEAWVWVCESVCEGVCVCV